MFQIYYGQSYGIFYVEYVGKGKEEELPTITARYERTSLTITAETANTVGDIKALELIYQGEKIPTSSAEKDSLSYTVLDPGWYIVKSTNTKGKVRYAWLKATNLSGNLDTPNIDVTAGTLGSEGWYKEGIEITASTRVENAGKICYRVVNSDNIQGETDEGWIEVDVSSMADKKVIIPQEKIRIGRNVVYAKIIDSTGKDESEPASLTVKYDNTSPSIQEPIVEGEGKNGWYRENVQVRINGDDTGSGLNGYWYFLNGSETGLHEKDINIPIMINSEGITTVRGKTIDKAGNESNLMEKTIKIDKEGPKYESGIEKSQVTETGFTINVLATDSLSRKLKI